MRLRGSNLFVFFVVAAAAAADVTFAANLFVTTRGAVREDVEQERRQAPSPPQTAQPTLPSNFWWPYASWGATTTTSITPPSTFLSPILVPTAAQGSMAASFSSPSTASSTDSTPSDTLSSAPSTTSTTSDSTSSSSLATPTTDSQRASSGAHVNYPQFFLPLIAVMGALLLLVLVWLLCRSCMRRRKRNAWRCSSSNRGRRDTERGWRDFEEPERGWWRRWLTRPEPIEEVIPGPRYIGVDESAEVEKGPFGGRGEPEFAARWSTVAAAGDDLPSEEQDIASAGDQHPLLSQEDSKVAGRVKATAARLARKMPSVRPPIQSRSTSLSFLEMYDSDNDEEKEKKNQLPWESLRHKSIKRAILAKVDEEKKWTESMRGMRAAKAVLARLKSDGAGVGRRQTHVRTDSDSLVAGGVKMGPSSLSSSSSSSRARSSARTNDREEGPDFRIVTDLESPPPQVRTLSKTWSLASSFPFFSNQQSEEEADRYTPVPTRMKSGSKNRASASTSPTKAQTPPRPSPTNTNGNISPSKAKRMSSAVLMRSPPHVMTPQMESALCFTPIAVSSPRMMDALLSCPDLADSNGMLSSLTVDRQPAELDHDHIFTKTYRVRTDRAMKQVEAIVENGWNEREKESPTRFGRVVV